MKKDIPKLRKMVSIINLFKDSERAHEDSFPPEVFKEYVSSVVDEGFDKDTSPIFHEIEQMNDQQKKDFHKAMIERVSEIKDSYPDNK